jgi:hypothetical protein
MPDNGNYLAAAYTVAAIILLTFAYYLYRNSNK